MHDNPRPGGVWRLLRPLHWIKNLFILAPVPFARAADNGLPWSWVTALLGIVAFCALSSAVYAFNDVWDRRRDRKHATKRLRPVASGAVSVARATVVSGTLAVAGLVLCAATGCDGALSLGFAYLALQLIYTTIGKRIALVDAFLLALGYLLRVLFGCALVSAPASGWLLLCTAALALFLALAKRRADLEFGPGHRPALGGYNRAFLDQAVGIAAGATLLSYALYAMEANVLQPGREFWGVPFVAFGVLEYLRLVHHRGEGGTPVETLLRTPTLWLSVLGWILATVCALA